MNLSIVLVVVINILGTHSHHCNLSCQLRNLFFGDTSRNDVDNCRCVPIYKCNLKDISTQRPCWKRFFGPDLVCCRRPVRYTTVRPPPRRPTEVTHASAFWAWTTKRPSQRPQPPTQGPPKTSTKIPARNPQSQPITKDPSLTTTQIPITNDNCTCLTRGECHDEDVGNDSQQNQRSCPNSNEVCCLGLVQKVTTPLPQSQRPTTSQRPTQSQTLGATPQPQLPRPDQPPPSTDKTCTCTPFFRCYDEETSSNLTNIVNDRTFIPNSCSDPNDICCYNLVNITPKPTVDSSFSDCQGSCIFIQECPHFVNKLKEAQKGNSDAIKDLRSSVCSKTNGTLHVCCPPEAEGSNNKFGVKFPDK